MNGSARVGADTANPGAGETVVDGAARDCWRREGGSTCRGRRGCSRCPLAFVLLLMDWRSAFCRRPHHGLPAVTRCWHWCITRSRWNGDFQWSKPKRYAGASRQRSEPCMVLSSPARPRHG